MLDEELAVALESVSPKARKRLRRCIPILNAVLKLERRYRAGR